MSSWLTKRHLGIFLAVSLTALFAVACVTAGDPGAQGAKGPQGASGAAGAAGGLGPQGHDGLPGAAGASGAAGPAGKQGLQGSIVAAAPSLITAPSAVVKGTTFVLRGAGFTPGADITVEMWDGKSKSTPPRIGIGWTRPVNSNGAFESSWGSVAAPGYYTILVADSSGRAASTVLAIVASAK